MRRPPLGPAWSLLAAGAVFSIAVLVLGDVRTGGYLLAATAAGGALLRLALPERLAGGIVVRRRGTDVLMYGLLAVALATVFSLVRL
ncbi:DUF3017 family protein [Yimella lutea]|uniref:DUF3017 family protein n=1 Tax=Yimella lutea TaxID=587872 RepID=A0A542EJX1_9MICO|nr:DUF3017 domain-containing protein [Yimella lutea]TQJ15629.1 DUF3017 family protein [Yimella lutea]